LHFWDFQDDGYAFTEDPTSHLQEIKVKDNNGELQTIPQLKSNESQKLLGVMKNPMGDQQDEITRLKQKSDNIAKRINTNKMTRAEAKLAYEAFYIPAVRYSLNITSINQMDMESIQSKAVLAFLAAQGFNRHMPREVVFAPTLFQGLGMRHMYDMQGADSTRLLLQELNQEGSMTQKMLISLLDTIQLEAGIGKPILENCKALAYIEWGWIPQIRDFLWHINGQIIGATETPKIYRENDQYLMDSPLIETLSRRDQIYIHRCRLHLQVETLSDITTSDGQHINAAWRHANTDKPSVSIVRWPRQKSPHKAVWKVWTKFLDSSFCTTKNKLRIQLGKWHTNNPTRNYQAYFVQDQNALWIQHGNICNRHEMILQKRNYWLFNQSTSTTAAHRPDNGTPIDIITQTYIFIKTLLTSSLQQNSNGTAEHTTWYQQHARDHHNITGKVDLLADPEEYPALFKQRVHIDIALDGGHEPTSGISTYGWVVAVNKRPIAKGRGAAEAHPLLAESFRAEGYGLSSALTFIHNLAKHFNLTLASHQTTIYIDNMALIQRIEGYRTQTPVTRWNLRSDEDITRYANTLLADIPANIVHVHSHQDEGNNWENLSFSALLNTMADEQASHHREMMDGPADEVTNLMKAQLRIGHMAITRDSQRNLIHAAGKIPLLEYYHNKWGWSQATFDAISWKIQKKALDHFDINDQTRIQKFVHSWLPTQTRLFKEGATTSPKCKLCSELYEDNFHLLNCQHPEMTAIQEDLPTFLLKQLSDHGNSELINILQLAISGCRSSKTWQPSLEHTSQDWKRAITDQMTIGWIHIFYGRLSNSMIQAMESHYQSLNINTKQYSGERWTKTFIINIWTSILKLWKQ
jgi:ribonuclease HI